MKTLLSVMVVASAALMVPQDSSKQSSVASTNASATAEARRAVPFGVGEKMEYRARYGPAHVGSAAMEVKSITTIRTRPAWNVQLQVSGGVPIFYNVKGVFNSWMDTSTLHALQYTSDQVENKRQRQRFYEIFPERAVYRLRGTPDTLPEMPSVADPLDEASFLYFIRTIPLVVGETYTYRYFRPDRNPVTIKVLGKEDVSVPAGIFPAIVIQPSFKAAGGLFAQGGEAKVWISEDPSRMILKIYSKAGSLFPLTLDLTKYTPAKAPPRG